MAAAASARSAGAASASAAARGIVAAALAAAAAVNHALGVGQLVPQAALQPAAQALAVLMQRDAVSLAFAVLVFHPRDDVLAGGNPHDTLRRVVGGTMLVLELRNRPDDGADRRPGFRLHDHLVARTGERIVGK